MSNDDLMRDVNRAARARALMDDELLKEAFDQLEKELTESWKKQKDAPAREQIWERIQALYAVKAYLANHLQNKGTIAQRMLAKLGYSVN